MSMQELATALRRAHSALARRPSAGLHDDAAGVARWQGGTRVAMRHPTGREVVTDMTVEMGGSGTEVSPGWMVRAGVASCTATLIVMEAAAAGTPLERLEVEITSRSDIRGCLGMTDADGEAVDPGPRDLEMRVRIAAPGVAPDVLRALVERGRQRSPMVAALECARPLALNISVEGL